jgi:hypothetical protein
MLIFRQLFDPQSSTYSYLLADRVTDEAILIDPVFEQASRDAAPIRELSLNLVVTIDTHVHADHVTGAWLLKKRLGGKIAISALSGAEGADIQLVDGNRIYFGARYVTALATPGHTHPTRWRASSGSGIAAQTCGVRTSTTNWKTARHLSPRRSVTTSWMAVSRVKFNTENSTEKGAATFP